MNSQVRESDSSPLSPRKSETQARDEALRLIRSGNILYLSLFDGLLWLTAILLDTFTPIGEDGELSLIIAGILSFYAILIGVAIVVSILLVLYINR